MPVVPQPFEDGHIFAVASERGQRTVGLLEPNGPQKGMRIVMVGQRQGFRPPQPHVDRRRGDHPPGQLDGAAPHPRPIVGGEHADRAKSRPWRVQREDGNRPLDADTPGLAGQRWASRQLDLLAEIVGEFAPVAAAGCADDFAVIALAHPQRHVPGEFRGGGGDQRVRHWFTSCLAESHDKPILNIWIHIGNWAC